MNLEKDDRALIPVHFDSKDFEKGKEYTMIFHDLLNPGEEVYSKQADKAAYHFLQWRCYSETGYEKEGIPARIEFVFQLPSKSFLIAYNQFKYTNRKQWEKFKNHTDDIIIAEVTFKRITQKALKITNIEVQSIEERVSF